MVHILDKRKKTDKEIIDEYKKIIKIYENISPINELDNSKIINDKIKNYLLKHGFIQFKTGCRFRTQRQLQKRPRSRFR